MKSFLIIVGSGLLLAFYVCSTIALEAPPQSEQLLFGGVNNTDEIVIAQLERGCCVLRMSRVKCVYTSKQYCEAQASKGSVNFEFHKGTSCREITSCPSR